jgi:hypothetical protein
VKQEITDSVCGHPLNQEDLTRNVTVVLKLILTRRFQIRTRQPLIVTILDSARRRRRRRRRRRKRRRKRRRETGFSEEEEKEEDWIQRGGG